MKTGGVAVAMAPPLFSNKSIPGMRAHYFLRRVEALAIVCLALVSQISLADSFEPPTKATRYVSTYVGTGVPADAAENEGRYRAAMAEPYGVVCDNDGNLYFSDYENNKVRKVDARSGKVTTVIALLAPQRLALDGHDGLYVGTMYGLVWKVDLRTNTSSVVAGGGTAQNSSGPALEMALGEPGGMQVDSAGNVYIADEKLHVVFRLTPVSGQLIVAAGKRDQRGFSGDGGPANDALLGGPADVRVDSLGNIYIVEAENQIVRFVDAQTGVISTLAGTPTMRGFSGDGGSTDVLFDRPQGLYLTTDNRLLIADSYNHRIRALHLETGTVSTIAGTGSSEEVGENVPAKRASLPYPVAIAANSAGTLFFSSPVENRIFQLGPASVIPKPWWQSPWSWLAGICVLAFVLKGVSDRRTRQLQARARALEMEVELRMADYTRQNEIVEQQATQLSKLADAKDQVLARISHEFRTPLTVILGPLDRMRDLASSDKERHYLDTTKRNASRLLRLVDQMLGLALVGADSTETASPVPAGPILEQVVKAFQSLADDRGIRLAITQSEAVSLQSTTDAVETIAVNLISNAIKYTDNGGSVAVTLTARGNMGAISVVDDGRGIDAEAIDRIFEPFERAHHEAERIPGSGLGLAVVRELVDTHGGKVEVDSVPEKGSTFRVFLPLANVVPGEATVDPTQRAEIEVSSFLGRPPLLDQATSQADGLPVVLVVEDNVDMQRYLIEVLSPKYRCLRADDDLSAISLAVAEIPDIVVSDIILPGRDGFAICRQLRNDARTCHIPVLLLTALDNQEHKLRGFGEQADDYIAKPFSEAELLLRIENLLELRKMMQVRFSRDLRFDLTTPSDLRKRDREFLGRLGGWIAARYQDPDLNLKTMTAAMEVSGRQLQRKIRALIGLSPSEFLRDYRLQKAHEHLMRGARPSEIAFRCGFCSHAYFSSCFKAEFGYSPSEARRRLRSEV